MIEQLRKYRENDSNMETNFLLAHNLYGKAIIPPTDKVVFNDLFIRIKNNLLLIGLFMVRCQCYA